MCSLFTEQKFPTVKYQRSSITVIAFSLTSSHCASIKGHRYSDTEMLDTDFTSEWK